MKFGYFCNPSNIDHQLEYREVINNAREIAQFCDQNAFETIWFAEHHFSIWGREVLPNPLVFAADIAARTERVRMGLAAAIITFWHPLRLAEDVALLDQLCDGRLELGLGRGNYGLEGLNLNPMADPRKPEENYLVFEDTLEILKRAFSEEKFNYHGKKYTFPTPGFTWDKARPVDVEGYINPQTKELINLSVFPKPLQKPWPPLWQVVDSPSSVEFAARNDLGLIMWRPPVEMLKERFKLYQSAASEASATKPALGKRNAIVRDTFVAPTMKQARELAEFYLMRSLNFYNWRGPGIFFNPDEQLSEAEQAEQKKQLTFEFVNDRDCIFFGTPERVVEQIQELQAQTQVEQVLINCAWAGMPHEHTMSSLRLFADEVMPRVT